MGIKAALATPLPYVAWLLASGVGLAVACAVHPYVFAFSAYAAAAIGGVLLAIAPWFGWRAFAWALADTIPTVVSFAVLSTYHWA